MKTIKIKLVFEPEIKISERKEKLENWAKIMLKKESINIVEVSHFEKLSWIVVENSKSGDKEFNYMQL
jgi:hypothetical protein